MAIVKLGATIVGIRGTIGGITYSANASSPYAKNWAQGPKKRTTTQQNYRLIQTQVATLWASESAANKTGWDTWAATALNTRTNSLGESYNPSGFNMYCSLQSIRKRANLSFLTSYPTTTANETPEMDTLTVQNSGSGASSITWTGTAYLSKIMLLDVALIPYNRAAAPESSYRNIICEYNVGGTSKDISSAISAQFGDPVIGWTAYARIGRAWSNGSVNTFKTLKTTVT